MTAGLIVGAVLVLASVIIASELVRRREAAIGQHADDPDDPMAELGDWALCGCHLAMPVGRPPVFAPCAEHAEMWERGAGL